MTTISKLGKYQIRRELGRGAMGVVYEGFDPMIERVVALKTIRADQLEGEDTADVIARFRREAQAAGRLNHPHVVSIYDFGEDAGTWFIAMEFVKGRELKDYFEANERFTLAESVRIMTELLDALDYSHRNGVVHRDIKPANIILLDDGSVKVADFGIARVETSTLTQTGMVLGTPSYMSPEQFTGLPVDGRSDLFSAGIVLYQFLTGERPFTGSATTIMHKVLQEDPLPPSMLNVQVSPAFDAVMKTALAKRPDDRFQTGHEFAAAIRAAATKRAAQDPDATQVRGTEATVIRVPDKAAGGATPTAAAPDQAGAPATGKSSEPAPTAAMKVGKAGDAERAPSAAAPRSQGAAIAVVGGVALLAIAAALWWGFGRSPQAPGGDAPVASTAPSAAPAAGGAPPKAPPPQSVSAAAAPPPPAAEALPVAAPGTLVVAALGLADPSDQRYANDKALLQTDLRADSKAQVVEKALGLYLDSSSLAKNYDLLREKLLSKSSDFVTSVVKESEPRTGKDGLVSLTTVAVVNVKALRKSLDEMSREERIEFIRANGDPRVAVTITAKDADQPNAPPIPSPVAENILKERIKSFGFRTWSDASPPAGAGATKRGADFAVEGEAKIKKLSARLPASGLTITKFTLTSLTVKCVDRGTGEEIYYNTALPKAAGSWASEEEALQAIGTKVADEFSRDFFLQHFDIAGQHVTLSVQGMPDATSEDQLARELVGLPTVITSVARPPSAPRFYDLQIGGTGPLGELVANNVLKPLNAKLGQSCFNVGAINGDQVGVTFDRRCAEPGVLSRLEANPPAGLYGATPERQRSVVKNPATLKKLMI